jgi:hypothetical protein
MGYCEDGSIKGEVFQAEQPSASQEVLLHGVRNKEPEDNHVPILSQEIIELHYCIRIHSRHIKNFFRYGQMHNSQKKLSEFNPKASEELRRTKLNLPRKFRIAL